MLLVLFPWLSSSLLPSVYCIFVWEISQFLFRTSHRSPFHFRRWQIYPHFRVCLQCFFCWATGTAACVCLALATHYRVSVCVLLHKLYKLLQSSFSMFERNRHPCELLSSMPMLNATYFSFYSLSFAFSVVYVMQLKQHIEQLALPFSFSPFFFISLRFVIFHSIWHLNVSILFV